MRAESRGAWLLGALECESVARTLVAGDVLFNQGDPPAAFYRVESGRVRLQRRTLDDHVIILHTASPGDFFAETALFADANHCDAIAVVRSRVLVYPKTRALEVLRAEPALAEAFLARLANHLQDLRARMELRNIRSGRVRMLQYLRLRAGLGRHTVAINGQEREIAADVGMTRAALNRTLATLEAEGSLTRIDGSIVLRTG